MLWGKQILNKGSANTLSRGMMKKERISVSQLVEATQGMWVISTSVQGDEGLTLWNEAQNVILY